MPPSPPNEGELISAPAAEPSDAAAASDLSIFAGKLALVAENDALIAMDLADTLQDLGLVVHQVTSAKAAFDYLLSAVEQPHISILDGRLTDGNVKTVASLLRSRRLPFIFMTGDPSWVRDWGFDVPVLSKPFSDEALLEALRLAVNH